MGFILYDGPSRLDGLPIVAIVTEGSTNPKTGPMAQVWIMRSDVPPGAAAASGADSSVCGDCMHRPAKLGTCYVNIWQAPRRVYDTFKAGRYPALAPALAPARWPWLPAVRLGAYGDPAAVPLDAWLHLTGHCPTWTGYTHQWRHLTDPAWRALLMASTDTEAETQEAQALGWRTFRVRRKGELVGQGEFICPASEESQHSAAQHTCMTCKSCNGKRPGRDNQASPVIFIHGARARRFNDR